MISGWACAEGRELPWGLPGVYPTGHSPYLSSSQVLWYNYTTPLQWNSASKLLQTTFLWSWHTNFWLTTTGPVFSWLPIHSHCTNSCNGYSHCWNCPHLAPWRFPRSKHRLNFCNKVISIEYFVNAYGILCIPTPPCVL